MANQMFDITGKRVIVTGSAQGLGNGMAMGYLESGCKVAFMDISDALDDVVKELNDQGYEAYAIKGNLGDREDLERMFNEAVDVMGGIDILVNAAGIQRRHRSDLDRKSVV